MRTKDAIIKLFDILTELDARASCNNCVVDDLLDKSWSELCKEGIRLFEEIE